MRLLFVHERIGALGGAEANVLLTAGELRRRGHAVALVHGRGTDRGEAEWRETFTERYPLGAAPEAGATARAIAHFRPDVVYLHKWSDPAVLGDLAAGDVPVVRMVHDHDLCCMRGYKYAYFSRRICERAASPYCVFPCGASVARGTSGGFPLRWVSYAAKRRELELNRRFHRLVVATDYMRAELLQNGFALDQIEVHAPVPRSAPAAELPSFGGRNLLVYAGQIIRGKGVDVLLEALARVEMPFECAILGDGSQRAECERLSRRLGLADRVHFAGFVPQARIADYYRDASLAVMSSLWPEPFGATGLEAMRCGLPVVAFDAGGIREWLLDGVNGFLVPWMDRATFARRVDTLLRDKPLARQLGAAGRQFADERFNFDSYIDGLEDLFTRSCRLSAGEIASNLEHFG
ncbi:MAG TPA: glycosyltransferase family 4 protein [Opitutaceae bacterium]|nr:glycosyltransferase family 4 protein [Opitutaceae bacterium]